MSATARGKVAALFEEVRAHFQRVVDRVILGGGALLLLFQLASLTEHPVMERLGPLVISGTATAVAGVAVAGRAPWSPRVYIGLITLGCIANLLTFGPLAGGGAMAVAAVTLAFVFLTRPWRWAVIGTLVVSPLLIGLLCRQGHLTAPTLAYADAHTWARMVVAVLASILVVLAVLHTTFDRLEAARAAMARALAQERTDAAERARVERELASSRRADLIVELAADVGADIGAALATITARAEALLAHVDREEARGCLADVITAADTAAATMRSLTVLNSELATPGHRSDAAHAARELPRIVRRMLPTGIVLRVDAPVEAYTAMSTTDLLRILSNLVLNARDAITGPGHIDVTVTATDTEVALEVRDTGSGMDAATQARVFQPFFTTKPVGRGTGLGLTTTKLLLEQVGGGISLCSAPGRGTTFRITLPRLPAPDARPLR